MSTGSAEKIDQETELALLARRQRLDVELRAVDGQLTRLRASSWSTVEAKDGSWVVQHAAGQRRYAGFSEGEARVVAAALNQLRRVRITGSVLLGGRPVGAGAEFDLPLTEARTLVSSKQAVFVP